jgi:hypothetical protein
MMSADIRHESPEPVERGRGAARCRRLRADERDRGARAILAAQLAHWVPVPLVVFEIVLGLMVVAITTIGTEAGKLDSGTAAALVGAGMLSVLLFPLIALRLRGETAPAARPGARAESW